LRYSAFLVVNLERSSGTFSGNCSAALSDSIIHYTSARYSVGCGIDPGSSGTETMGSSDGRKGSCDKHPIKHVSREDYQEFLAARCIKNLG
jgi:hypothetical protein